MNDHIVNKASQYVCELIKNNVPPCHFYHNVTHTCEVVEAGKEICQAMGLNESDTEVLLLTAWFHDTGFVYCTENHEERSVEIAEKFLFNNGYPDEAIAVIKRCILVTNVVQKPQDLLEEIIRDADISHFGKKNFFRRNDLLRLEWEKCEDKKFTDLDWLNSTYRFFKTHPFYTQYAKKEYEKQRLENLHTLEKLIKVETEKLSLIK